MPAVKGAAPILGPVAGSYHERAPTLALRRHFARVWINRIPPGGSRRLTIAPDGCIDLQWIDGDLRIAGPDRRSQIEDLSGGTTVVGMRFRPGAAAAWLRVPASEIVDQRLPLEAFWGAEARQIAQRLGESGGPDTIDARLEAELARKAGMMAAPPDGTAGYIFRLLSANRHAGAEIVPLLTDQLGLSERTLRRKCNAAFGYGPKTLDRILRFQRFLRLARSADPGRLAGLAGASGYADQAHLTREARRMAGLTPSQILAQLALWLAVSFKTSPRADDSFLTGSHRGPGGTGHAGTDQAHYARR